ncbi:MAG: hypothetical protein H6993_03965 [Pseudomonadales bacterium]|nr:hypothetical protein [Pseudomonadales bacterium]MCP5183091.1 hypothetical protein [Pseudomonadales bacterium]
MAHARCIGSLVCLLAGLASVNLSASETWDRNVAYVREEARLRATVQAHPDAAQAYAALGWFYMDPVVSRDVAAVDGRVRRCLVPLRDELVPGGGKTIFAAPWVLRGDPGKAIPVLRQALQIDPRNHLAHRGLALAYRMREDVVRMQEHVLLALRIDPMDLDMARLYLDFHTVQARILNDRAGGLRTQRRHEEDRPYGRRVEVITYPSQADLAQAAQLDQQAQGHRREAFEPLKHIMKATKGDAGRKSLHDLANAIYYYWTGDLGTSAGAAKAALEADPTNLRALDYLIDLAQGTHTPDLYRRYLGIRDRWAGASTAARKAPAAASRPKA